MNIPKIIHYCWFGQKGIPETELQCMASWKVFLPDYEFRFWNESTFNIDQSVPYVKECYRAKKYAFVSDYVRMYVLNRFGGVYLDTDVEVLKPIDQFLEDEFFIGFENRTMLGTGIIGSVKGHWLTKEMLDYYASHNFIDANGNQDVTTNVKILSGLIAKYGFVPENKEQVIRDLHIYERDIFQPKKLSANEFRVTDRTVTLHKISGSWLTEREKRRGESLIWRNFFRPNLRRVRKMLVCVLGEDKTRAYELKIRRFLR